MDSNKTGPLPYKPGKPPRDPFVEAILSNPRPFIMMSVGAVGMLLVMIFGSMGSRGAQQSAPPQTGLPAAEQSPVTAATVEDIPATPISATVPVAPPPVTNTDVAPTEVTADAAGAEPVPAPVLPPTDRRYITLIIDDIGNSQTLGARAVALPGAITYAVLPHTPHGAELAELAHNQNKEVMLHAPMSNLAQMPLGPGGLSEQLSREEFMSTLYAAIDAVPHLQGVNNHMGSQLTGQPQQMQWVMEALRDRGLYFVDSLTIAGSVAGRIAREQEIPTVTRNVFLDNVVTTENIDKEFQRLLQLARDNGGAVGIGHPYKETLDYLELAVPALATQNIEIIPVSAMIELQKTREAAAAKAPLTDAL